MAFIGPDGQPSDQPTGNQTPEYPLGAPGSSPPEPGTYTPVKSGQDASGNWHDQYGRWWGADNQPLGGPPGSEAGPPTFGAADLQQPDFMTLKNLGFGEAEIASIMQQSLGQIQQNRDYMTQAIGDIGTAGQQRTAFGQDLLSRQAQLLQDATGRATGAYDQRQAFSQDLLQRMAEFGQDYTQRGYSLMDQAANLQPIDFSFIHEPSVEGQDFKTLQKSLFDLEAEQLLQDAEKVLGYLPNFSHPGTIQTLMDSGIISAGQAARLGDPSSILSTKVGSLQSDYMARGGLGTLEGPYLAAYGNVYNQFLTNRGQAAERANVDAYKLLLQNKGLDIQQAGNLVAQQGNVVKGYGVAGDIYGTVGGNFNTMARTALDAGRTAYDPNFGLQLGNLVNQSAQVAGDIGQFTYDPRTPWMQAQVAQQMPTLWPQAQWMAGADNTLAQQTYQNQVTASELDLRNRALAQQGELGASQIGAESEAARDRYLASLIAAGGSLGAQALAFWYAINKGKAPPPASPGGNTYNYNFPGSTPTVPSTPDAPLPWPDDPYGGSAY